MDELRESIRKLAEVSRALDKKKKTRVSDEIEQVLADLRALRDEVDPVVAPKAVLDPTNPVLIGNFIGIALLAQPSRPLQDVKPFHGSGVYAIYYHGKFRPYQSLKGDKHPIYVGKAAPGSAIATTPREQEQKLFARLREHSNTVSGARNLSIKDFAFRFLVVHTGWESSAEKFLIDMFRPIWNGVVNGFGNHVPGSGRPGKRLPAWDALHPGRTWAAAVSASDRERLNEVTVKLKRHFDAHPTFKTKREIMEQFFTNLRQ